MQRDRKKKGKGKRKKVKRKCMDERETLAYEQEILDNNRQLARLRSRNEELEEQAEVIKEKLIQLEDDRSDIIAHLQRDLNEKTQEATELTERLAALEEQRKQELATYKKKYEAMELEYQTMENNLTAEVNLVAGKLNALEDWRLARLDLMRKFEKQEQDMVEQEARNKEALYQAEKAVVVGKALLQKEMKEHLDILSKRLQKAVTLRVTDVMSRAIRENVGLNRELDVLLKTNRKLEITNSERKKTEQMLTLKGELVQTELNVVLKKAMRQRNIIHQTFSEFQRLLANYGQVEKMNVRLEELQHKLEEIIERKDTELNENIKKYEKNVLLARQENKVLSEGIEDKEKELKKLKDILDDITTFLNEALQVSENAYCNQQCFECMGLKMLQTLLEILDTDTITGAVNYTASEIDDIDCKYTLGCLGFIEAIKKKEDVKEEHAFNQEVEEEELYEEMEGDSRGSLKTMPSCLLSEISFSVPSPKE